MKGETAWPGPARPARARQSPLLVTMANTVDASQVRHYVTPVAETRDRTDCILRLLLNLIALIAGLTGLVAGQPAAARAGEPAAIAAALSGTVEQASESAAVQHLPVPAANRADAADEAESGQAVLAPQSHPVDERRIE